jgi:HEAT repeat protein
MRKRRKWLWILLGGGIAVVLVLTLWREREPHFENHSLLEWISIADIAGHGDKDSEFSKKEGEDAVRHIGTNAIPFLIKCIQYRERPWQTHLGALSHKLPEKLADPLSDLIEGHGAQRQEAAFSGLYMLGPDAKGAIPALTNLMTTQRQLANECLAVLAQIGGDGLTPVLNALTNQASPHRIAAFDALVVFGTNRPLDRIVISTLADCLSDTNRDLAFYAAQILCCHDSEKELAMKTLVDGLATDDERLRRGAITRLKISLIRGYSVPDLLQFLQDTNSPLSPYSAGALGQLASDGAKLPDTVLPALTNALHDLRPKVRAYAASAVGHFRESAEPAAPALLDLWNDPDQSVRQFATNAFFELPRYSGMRSFAESIPGLSEPQLEMYEKRYGITTQKSALKRLFNDPDIRVRETTTNAYRMMRGSNFVDQTQNASH